MRCAYQTDFSDAEWSYVGPHIPTPKAPGRPRVHPLREILDAIFYIGDVVAVPSAYCPTIFLHGRPSIITSELGGSTVPGRGCTALCANGSALVWVVIPSPVQG